MSSSGSSEGSIGEATKRKRLQFGETDTQDFEVEDNFEEGEQTESFENINARLRHQIPQVEEAVQTKFFPNCIGLFIIVTLEECLSKIILIREMNHIEQVDVNLHYVPLREKYTTADHDIETLMHSDEAFYIARKFKKDLSWIEKIFRVMIADLQRHFYFDALLKFIKDHELAKQDETMVLKSKEFNRKELERLRFYIDDERRELTKLIQELTEELGNAKDQLNDSMAEYKVKVDYVKKWEKSRYEQNSLTLQQKESNYRETTRRMNLNTNREDRVHIEMMSYLDTALKENAEQIEQWMDRYDKESEEKEKQVEGLKFDVEKIREKYSNLLEEYNERVEEMEAYKAHKIELQKEAEELARQTRAVVKIQSWWRGVMFRKGLGPFRRKKKKGKKSGSAKDSAKKRK